ncbi:C-type mannose receptor 2-like [Salarias fasciatus]|uniref:C-type mannose receptor 2-like n=1 Tax=Salarias fasciatus TaxID=181472 RepID=UPI0011768F82|nr:C-type mannose receptor 2-like [Salarias fasciatus]
MYPEKKNWTDAQAFCRRHHTDLITIRTAEENQDTYETRVWIGLYKKTNDDIWKWSRGDENATFLPWRHGEPHYSEKCALKGHNSTTWMNLSCNRKNPFVCSDEKLVLVKQNKTWEEALDHCRSLGGADRNHTYDLVSLASPADYSYARESVKAATTDEVWTGLRFLAGHWFWAAGEAYQQHQDIQSCPGLTSCGVLEKTTGENFQTRDCGERRNFLCYKTPSLN